ncbi:hypothetical protein B0H13DRAFT_2012603 [Mycena leptocephala]|nr:hypothetical protein B0H13DRAFT_2012603 [Mycena leptocephala]
MKVPTTLFIFHSLFLSFRHGTRLTDFSPRITGPSYRQDSTILYAVDDITDLSQVGPRITNWASLFPLFSFAYSAACGYAPQFLGLEGRN